jgi:ABC-2 type transport system ATP-binding protein
MTNNDYAIYAEKLTKKFGAFTAVNQISFEVKRGEIFGFLGSNGAGKTTAMKMLCGLSKPSSGDAQIAGFDIYKQTEEIKKNIGYMSQKFALYEDLTLKENIQFYGGIYGIEKKALNKKIEELIDNLGLKGVQNELVKALPLGWKQKIAFSTAIIHDPAIVFLDEPTGGVDPIARRQFWELIYQAADRGVTVFVTTHYLDEAEYCNRISMMADGVIEALGTPNELKSKYSVDSMEKVFLKIARGV